jgi:hypothetical protein
MLTHSNYRRDIDATFALLAGLFASLSDTDISIVERPCRSAVGKPRGGLFLTGRTSHSDVDCSGGPDWPKVWHRFESDLRRPAPTATTAHEWCVPIVVATGSGALTSHVLGSKDQVIVAINMTKVGGGIFAKNEIRSAEDLRSKTIGVSRAGSISEIVLRYVLRAKLGLQPDRDVKLLVVGDPAVGLQALERGIVDARR